MKKGLIIAMLLVSLAFLSACTVKIDSLQISDSSISLNVGDSKNLNFFYEPADKDPKLIWSSSNTNVVSVSNGVIFGVSKGNATVTVSFGDLSSSVSVTVISISDLFNQIYGDLESVTINLNEVSSSIISAWNFAIFDSDKYSFTNVVFRLWLKTGNRIITTDQLVNAYNSYYDTNYTESTVGLMIQGDFSRTVFTVRQAYITLGAFSSALSSFNEVRSILQSLDPSTPGYSQFQVYYLKVRELYDAIDNITGNYTTFSTNVNNIKTQIQSSRNTAGFYAN
jgi:hypothetical protein